MGRAGLHSKFVSMAILLGLFVVFVSLIWFVPDVHAQLDSSATETLGEASGLSTLDLAILIARIIRAVLQFLGIVLVCLLVYAGYIYLTSAGEKEKIDKSKKIIQSAIIGLLIIFASYSLAAYILAKLLEAAGLSGASSSSAAQYSEPLSGSLGSGIIDTHYPARDATDVPRNTRIMVTFKEAIELSSIMVEADGSAYDGSQDTTNYLRTEYVQIYQSADEDEDGNVAEEDLATATVSFTDDQETFVFDPVEYLGNADTDTNYTVFLSPSIALADGTGSAFTGDNDEGYEWQFEVSTELDLTPPTVVSVVPEESSDAYDRNITVSITFDDAMDPVAGSGEYDPSDTIDPDTFGNIDVLYTDSSVTSQNVEGSFGVTNNYRTIEFTTNDACSQDPCGNTIYCLPASSDLEVQAHAATLSDDAPQAETIGGLFDGLVDAAGNSLDGDADGTAEGPGAPDAGGDDYEWEFSTSSTINDDVPELYAIEPTLSEEDVELDATVAFTFNMLMQSSTLGSSNIQLVPDQDQTLWFVHASETLDSSLCPTDNDGNAQTCTKVTTDHADFWESDEASAVYYNYYPVITQGVKSAYQICMRPAYGPSATSSSPSCATDSYPFCCDGLPSTTACETANLEIELGD